MTTSSIKQCVEALLAENTRQGFSQASIQEMPMYWGKLSGRSISIALDSYLPVLAKHLPRERQKQAGTEIARQISSTQWARRRCVHSGDLGACLDKIQGVLGIQSEEIWKETEMTNINRIQDNKTRYIDLRALGQIRKNAPGIFHLALSSSGNASSVASNLLTFTMLDLKANHEAKQKMRREVIDEIAWATVGMIEQLDDQRKPGAGGRAAWCAYYLRQAGISRLPSIKTDISKMEEMRGQRTGLIANVPDEGWAMLREAGLAHIVSHSSPKDQGPRKPIF